MHLEISEGAAACICFIFLVGTLGLVVYGIEQIIREAVKRKDDFK